MNSIEETDIKEFTDELIDPLDQFLLDPLADGEPTDQHPDDWADECISYAEAFYDNL